MAQNISAHHYIEIMVVVSLDCVIRYINKEAHILPHHKFVFNVNLFFLINLFIYLFLAVLGLRFCVRAFSSCGQQGPLFIAVRGPLTIAASLVAEHRLQTRRLSSCGSWA